MASSVSNMSHDTILCCYRPTGEIKTGTPLTSIALQMDGTRIAVGGLDGREY